MGNITLSLPDTIHNEMKQFPEVKWSEVARKAIIEKMAMLRLAERIVKKSNLSEKDVRELSKKINRKATKAFLEQSSIRT